MATLKISFYCDRPGCVHENVDKPVIGIYMSTVCELVERPTYEAICEKCGRVIDIEDDQIEYSTSY